MPHLVIVGSGHAAGALATSLPPKAGFDTITMVSADPHLPYHRPPLSKTFLSEEMEQDRLFLRPASFYAEAGIELRLGVRADRIDRVAATVALSDGSAIGYDRLVLATGARVRRLAVPGAGLDGVFYLRSLDDARRLRSAMLPGRRLVVIGGGYVGLEVAASAVKRGLRVTVLEAGPRVLGRVASPWVAGFLTAAHRAAGVVVMTAVTVTAIEGHGTVAAVRCADDARIEADLVVVGIGVLPNVELADQAGLDVAGGFVVDGAGRTTDPAILAAGDCAALRGPSGTVPVRIESVQNAADQVRAIIAGLCGDPPCPRPVPWFWSDQYALKLQMAGLPTEYMGAAIRPGPRPDGFSEFYMANGRLVAVTAVNRPQEFMLTRRALEAGPLDISPASLADPAQPLQPQLDAAVRANLEQVGA